MKILDHKEQILKFIKLILIIFFKSLTQSIELDQMIPKFTVHDEIELFASLSRKSESPIKQIKKMDQSEKTYSPCKKRLFNNLIESDTFGLVKAMKRSLHEIEISSFKIEKKNSHKHAITENMQEAKLLSRSGVNLIEPQKKSAKTQPKAKGVTKKEIFDFNQKLLYFQKKFSKTSSDGQQKQNSEAKSDYANVGQKFKKIRKNGFQGIQDISKVCSISTSLEFKGIINLQTSAESTGESSVDEEILNPSKQLNKSVGIQDFEQIKMLGSGCYGQVSLARHKKTNFLVAIKRIAKSSLTPNDAIYLARQIKIQSYLDHPNVVKLYTFFHDSENIYLVLEVCNQGNLFSILKDHDGKIPQSKVKSYIRQICTALRSLHENDILHRDLKPENILVHNGVAKICDFGWAVHAPQLRHSLCGTPLYASPQLVKNEKYDNKIDIWNIGVMTYELICGKDPFTIRCQQDFKKVVQDTVQYPTDGSMSEQCINFIKGCLEKNSKDRFESWQLIKHPFVNIKQRMRQTIAGMWSQERFCGGR